MRKIGIKEIEDIALGAALLGAGGGGDPYAGGLRRLPLPGHSGHGAEYARLRGGD